MTHIIHGKIGAETNFLSLVVETGSEKESDMLAFECACDAQLNKYSRPYY